MSLIQNHPHSTERQLELAIVRVDAQGHILDEASEIVSATDGRLIELHEAGFTVQVVNRPETIDAMLERLKRLAPVQVNRSGALAIDR